MRHSALIATLGILCGALCIVVLEKACPALPLGYSLWSSPAASAGYVLVAPYFSENFFDKPGVVDLIDTKGTVVHQWRTRYPVLDSYLQESGHLYVAMTPPIDGSAYPSGGTTGLIQELDWDGKLVWEYRDPDMTHDFEVMPDGGVTYIRWSRTSRAFAHNIVGGLATQATTTWSNQIVRVDRDKKIVWTWHPEDHLNPKNYPMNPLVAKNDWAHMNSIRYLPDNPLTHVPAFLASVRNISTVFMIDAESGKVLWRSPAGVFSLQHDATLTPEGRVLVFDNGLFRPLPAGVLVSRVAEIDPRTNSIAWTYFGGKTQLEKIQFGSSIMSGAQRLANGNTFITASMLNTLYEVDQSGAIVWRYSNDFRDADGMHVMFKSRKYDPAGTKWGNWISAWRGFQGLLCR